MPKTKRSFTFNVGCLSVIGLLTVIGVFLFGLPIENDSGVSTGIVVDQSHRGLFFKADTMQIVAGDGQARVVWMYDLPAKLVSIVQEYAKKKSRIIVTYKGYWIAGMTMHTQYLVVSVEEEKIDAEALPQSKR